MLTLVSFVLVVLAMLYLQVRKKERAKGRDFKASPRLVKISGGLLLTLIVTVSVIETWRGGLTRQNVLLTVDGIVIALSLLYYRYLRDRNNQ